MNDNPLTPTVGHSERCGRSSLVCRLTTLMTIAFIVTLALAAAHRLRGQAFATLIGLATGAAATTLAIFFTTSRRRSPTPPVSLSPCLPIPLSQIPSLTDAEQDLAEGDKAAEVPAGTPFEELPEGWVCPICGVGKDRFEPLE